VEPSEILASTCRQKILRVLSYVKSIRIMKLVQKTGCRYNEVMRNLRILEKEDIIIYTRLRHNCTISFNHDNYKTTLLIKAIKILDTPVDSRQHSQKDCMELIYEKYLDPTE